MNCGSRFTEREYLYGLHKGLFRSLCKATKFFEMVNKHHKDAFDRISEERRERILEVGTEEFSSKGYENAKITKNKVKDLGLPKGTTIGGLIRNGEGILVTGDTLIQAGDHVVVFCLSMMIKKIEKYFN